MVSIPDWAWKILQLFIIPVALWAIATHISLKNQELRLKYMEDQVKGVEQSFSNAEQQLSSHQKAITKTEQDIEILKVRMEYVVKGIDDIKTMLEEDRRNQK